MAPIPGLIPESAAAAAAAATATAKTAMHEAGRAAQATNENSQEADTLVRAAPTETEPL